jgi:hypothetical protein
VSRPVSIHDIQDSELSTINMMLYGHPGEGKTPFWGTGGPRLLLMDCDNGYESAMAHGSQCKRAPVQTYDELEEMYQFLKDDSSKPPDKREFDWVAWDSLTLFQDRALFDDIMEDAAMENPNQDRDVPSKREYRKDHSRILRYMRQFVSLPINFGVSCHVAVQTDVQDGTSLWMPAVQGWSSGTTMSSVVSGYCNIVALMGTVPIVKEGKPTGRSVKRLLTEKQGKLYARDRFNALGPYVDNPTVPKIEELISKARSTVTAEEVPSIPRRRRRRVS